MIRITLCFTVLACAGCAGPSTVRPTCQAGVQAGLASGQTPAGVVGISVPDVYYQSANSFPKGAAHVDECL